MAPSFRVKLPDSILDILYKCTIGTNSLPADSSKHCGKTGPSLSKYHFAEASPYHAIHLSVTSLFSLNVTLTSNLLHVALKLALLQPLQTFHSIPLLWEAKTACTTDTITYRAVKGRGFRIKHVSQFDVTTSLHRTHVIIEQNGRQKSSLRQRRPGFSRTPTGIRGQ